MEYLTNIPAEASEYGLDKVLAVRSESIHLKHIFTEIFDRKTIDLGAMLSVIGINVYDYMNTMTNRFRKIYHFSRDYQVSNYTFLTKDFSNNVFEQLDIYRGLNNVLVVNFEGVVDDYNFQQMFWSSLFANATKVIVITKNRKLDEQYFIDKQLKIPEILYRKEEEQKIRSLISMATEYDNLFFIDTNKEYLDYAWIYGWKTYQFVPEKKKEKKIHHYTLKTNPK